MKNFIKVIGLLFSYIILNGPIPMHALHAATMNEYNIAAFTTIPNNAYDATLELPKNADKSGKTNYATHLNRALKNNRIVVLPDFPVMVDVKGLQIPSNTKLYFRKNSKLVMQPNNQESYFILKIENASNIEIHNAYLEGDRYVHKGKTGEWGMGIGMYGAKNVLIKNAYIKNCWGDGIYIGATGNQSSNITIDNFSIDAARRNGISIINARNVELKNGDITNIRGTNPQMGIDVEPNKETDEIQNINIENVYTNNCRIGIGFVLAPMLRSKTAKNVTINIVNHSDYKSDYPLRISGRNTTGQYKNLTKYHNFTGGIQIINPKWIDNKENAFIISEKDNNDFNFLPTIKLQNAQIKVNGKNMNPAQYQSGNKNLNKKIQSKEIVIQ